MLTLALADNSARIMVSILSISISSDSCTIYLNRTDFEQKHPVSAPDCRVLKPIMRYQATPSKEGWIDARRRSQRNQNTRISGRTHARGGSRV
jgi:hypothetical protein